MAEAEHLDVGAWGSLDGVGDAGSEDRQQAVRGSFATMCDSAMALGAAVAVVALATGHFMVGCLVGAVLCGMAEAHGRCGMSHIGMTAPFAGFEPRMWLRCVSAYSIAGVATSYLVGLAIAGVGTLAAYAAPQMLLYLGAAAVVVAMMLRELGLIRFDPPQCNVQTHKDWVYEFGLPTATGMWVPTSAWASPLSSRTAACTRSFSWRSLAAWEMASGSSPSADHVAVRRERNGTDDGPLLP